MKPKGRPKIKRRISSIPKISQFSPRGRPGRPDEVALSMDEYEAIRLADYEGLGQAEAAEKMQISRATFGRIIREARKKLADGLINGKIIKII